MVMQFSGLLDSWAGRKVTILGAARQGLALARYFLNHQAQVVLNDLRPYEQLAVEMAAMQDLPEEQIKRLSWVCGGHPFMVLDDADLLCISGGVPVTLPLIREAMARGIQLSNDSQVFLEATPATVIGITGSAGKTTTTTIVGRMARESVRMQAGTSSKHAAFLPKAWVGGNIGQPLIANVDEMRPEDLCVMELSSFQLEIITRSPKFAAILNVTPNHLDRHGTMQAYTAAKARILDFQGKDDVAILGRDDPGAWGLADRVRGRLISFGLGELSEGGEGTYYKQGQLYIREELMEEALLPHSVISLRGEHNLQNVLAACAIASGAGLSKQAMIAGISDFTGVAHRLEFVHRWGGADWYNDSIATTPERAMAAIRSFDEPLVLLAGGRDKDLPWDAFAELVCHRVDHVILFGEAAGKISQALRAACSEVEQPSIVSCTGLQQAVMAAAEVVRPGDVVLLSPGGTSFDEFRDFEERGLCFAQWVRELQ